MAPPTYIVMHKKEWERIKRQGGPQPEDPGRLKSEYLQSLTELSQEWVKSWPDTEAGHLVQVEKKKEEEHKSNIAYIKSYKKQTKKVDSSGPIKEAKQLIFENSCYGRKLLSALLESRAIDVRDAQIKFRKEIQQKEAESEKQKEKARQQHVGVNDLHAKDTEREKAQKCGHLECVKYNKDIAALKKEVDVQKKLKEKQDISDDKKFLKDVLQSEKIHKEAIKRVVQNEIKKFESDTKEIKNIKAQENALDDALIKIHNKSHDRIECKSRAILKKIHQGRPDTMWSKDLYKKVEQLQNEEMKRYEMFVEKGIETLDDRASGEKTRDKLRDKERGLTRLLMSQQNKMIGEEIKLTKKYINKCSCDRGTLVLTPKTTERKPEGKLQPKYDAHSKNTKIKITDDTGLESNGKNVDQKCSVENICVRKPKKILSFEPRTQMLEDLKKRAKEPSGWNSTKVEHVLFAQQADSVLKEIKHKYFARKVVDEYRKTNCLDDTTLPVPNY